MTRTSILGGEVAGRGLLGKMGRTSSSALAVTTAAAIWLWLGVGGIAGLVAGLGAFLFGVVTLYPWGNDRCLAEVWIRAGRFAWRRSRARTVSDPEDEQVPPALGRVEPLELGETPHEDMFVLRHSNPGEQPYLSVVLEVDGQRRGLRTQEEFATSSAGYGLMLSQLARDGSFIRGLQQINRIVPHDPSLHQMFVTNRLSDRPGIRELVTSYADLVDLTANAAEQHRNYLVARFPITGEFIAAARRYGTAEVGWAGLVREELARFADLAARADLARPRVLGEQRTCAVLRSIQDPGFPIDQHEGVHWHNCWQPQRAERDHLEVNGTWLHRFATVPRDAIAAVPLGQHWLAPLLVEVNPAVIRTLSVRMEFVPARVARARAVRDVAADGASMHEAQRKRQVGDGTDEVMLSASRRRLDDLTPGSGHHGVDWSMTLSVTAADPGELTRACSRVSNAAANCGISRLVWQDMWHDAAAVTSYPLARGMAVAR